MANWFDPDATPVRLVLIGGMLASLLMAVAVPHAFTSDGDAVRRRLRRAPGRAEPLQRRGRRARLRCAPCSSAARVERRGAAAVDRRRRSRRATPRGDLGGRRWPWTTPRRWSATGRPGRGCRADRGVDDRGRRTSRSASSCSSSSRSASRSSSRAPRRPTPVLTLSGRRRADRLLPRARPRCGGCTSTEVAGYAQKRLATARATRSGSLARDAYTYLHVPIVAGDRARRASATSW